MKNLKYFIITVFLIVLMASCTTTPPMKKVSIQDANIPYVSSLTSTPDLYKYIPKAMPQCIQNGTTILQNKLNNNKTVGITLLVISSIVVTILTYKIIKRKK